MKYTLLSPIKIPIKQVRPKDAPFQAAFEANLQDVYVLKEHGLEVNKPINTFYKSIPMGSHQAHFPKIMPLTEEVAEAYLKFQSIIGHCITNSEAINNQLRDLLLSIRELNHSKEEIMKMDFMKLRDVFSDFLKSYTAIQNEPNFSKDQIKALTRIMNQFITDRNIYTHGVLRIQRPEDIFVIDYIEGKKEKARVQVTLEILDSFLQISDLMRSLLNQISSFYQNVNKTKTKDL